MEASSIFVVIFIVIFFSIINYAIYKSVMLFSEPEKIINEIPSCFEGDFLAAYGRINEWCMQHGFTVEKYFEFYGVLNGPPILCASWQNDREKTRTLLYVAAGKTLTDFVTLYNDATSLTTGSTKDVFTLPLPPTYYLQAFTGLDTNALYQKHLAARSLIESATGMKPVLRKDQVLVEVASALRRQMEYIKSIPAWYLRGVYWYFVRRYLKVNKPVAVVKI